MAIVLIANPFDLPIYNLKGSFEESSAVYYQGSSEQQEVADEDEDEPSVRITTRARFTYELDRFNKNLMLIINNNITDSERTVYLMEAFYKHKFEFTLIETDQENDNEIWSKINQFFQRDFSDIGAVAISTALFTPGPGSSMINRVKEWDVLDYYMVHQPASLQGKPKIFISESPEPSTLPHTSLPSDTLLIQTHINLGKRPLILLCSKLISMEGTCDILDILSEVNHVAHQEILPNDPSPVTCLSTMSKELLLEKNVPEPEEEFECEWQEDFYSRITSDPNLFEIYARLFKITLPVPEESITESTQLDGDLSQPSTSESQNDTTEQSYTAEQIDTTDQSDTTEQNDIINDQNDTTEQNDAIDQNCARVQLDGDLSQLSTYTSEAQNDITEQRYTAEQIDTTGQSDTTEQNDITNDQNDTTEQNDAIDQNCARVQNDTTDQNNY